MTLPRTLPTLEPHVRAQEPPLPMPLRMYLRFLCWHHVGLSFHNGFGQVAHPASTRGCSLPDRQVFPDTVAPSATAVTWPLGTTIG